MTTALPLSGGGVAPTHSCMNDRHQNAMFSWRSEQHDPFLLRRRCYVLAKCAGNAHAAAASTTSQKGFCSRHGGIVSSNASFAMAATSSEESPSVTPQSLSGGWLLSPLLWGSATYGKRAVSRPRL